MKAVTATIVAFLLGAAVLGGSRIAPRPPRSRLARDLAVFWVGSQQQERISRPGKYELQFPCSFAKGKAARLTVQVEREGTEDEEGEPYRQCTPAEARRLALAGSRDRVRFEDVVAEAPRPTSPLTWPTVRTADGGEVHVAFAFAVAEGPTCLIPKGETELLELARSVLPGDEVSVGGRLLGGRGEPLCVLVEELAFPGRPEPRDEPPWTVTVLWGGREIAKFSQPGDYPLRPPCLHSHGAAETVQLRLREFKVVDLEVDGRPVVAELADTPATRSWGLQGRRDLGPNEGMLFHFGRPLVPVFLIKTVPFPLSVAFIRSDGVIVGIGKLDPGDRRGVQSSVPVDYVLEMKQGWFEKHGVAPGSKVTIP